MRMLRSMRWIVLCVVIFAASAQASARGRHKKIYIVPTPGKITVDAKLDDWDLSGQILTYVVPETQDMQSARTAMMYDAEALYICGIVRDTSPMMNRHDPKTNPDKAWDADVCQIFFSLDPDATLPLPYHRFDKKYNRSPVATMMLWHFTDRKESCLSIYQGMQFNVPLRPDLSKDGVIPTTHYQGAYRKTDDGGGYVFEYRLPFATLGLKRTPKANDILALSTSVFWGRPDGLKTAGGAAWAYDVMSGPGFTFQNSNCWGKAVFHPTNNVDEKLVKADLPPEKPLPLKFTYDLPHNGEITVQIMNKDNDIVRLLVPQQFRRAGKNTELWDGLDDHGHVLPTGEYHWKGIIHDPLKVKYLFSVHNSGKPAYPTDNNKGGWGGDHGNPSTVCALPDGMALAWNGCEFGWGIIRVDLNGKKLWGSKYVATHLASDGKHLFIAGGHGFEKSDGVRLLDAKDSRPISFPGGFPAIQAPAGGTKETDAVTGLAYHKGTLYVSYAHRNLIGLYDSTTGKELKTWSVPAPERIAVRPDGSLLVISNKHIIAVTDGTVSTLITKHIDHPASVEVGADGSIYVANRGALQNISVFDASGNYARSIGKQGGRPAKGRYDPRGMYMAGGMRLDAQGRLWVAETTDGPKRISVWDTKNGENVNEFFGGSSYFGYGCMDPARPEEIYAHHVLWKIDWKTNTATPSTTTWRKTGPNMIETPSPCGYRGVVKMLTDKKGHQFMWGRGAAKTTLLRREGDLFKPCVAFMSLRAGKGRGNNHTGIKLLDDSKAFPEVYYLWQDVNDDQCVQAEELTGAPISLGWAPAFEWIDKDMNILFNTGHILRPVKFKENGQPVYDITKIEETFMVNNKQTAGYKWIDSDGALYNMGGQMSKWSADGKQLWSYPKMIRWHDALGMPIVKAGRLWGTTGPLGEAGEFFGHMTYFGVCHLFTRDGIYVGAVLRDDRMTGLDAYKGQPEGQNGRWLKVRTEKDGKDRYIMIHGGQDSRVWEILGLDTVKSLPGGTYNHSEALVATAKNAQEEYKKLMLANKQFNIVRGLKGLEAAEKRGASVDAERFFKACAAYDTTNLYVQYNVTTPAELVNGIPEEHLLFRGGNCLDIQLATDPTQGLARKKVAQGDVRLLVTRRNGKPFAMLYRPKVKDFTGTPKVLTSPTGSESFDVIERIEGIALKYRKTQTGFSATVTIPLEHLGWTPKAGEKVLMDLGYLFGNPQGMRVSARAYLYNTGFSAGVTNDIPNESRLEPQHWGTATIE